MRIWRWVLAGLLALYGLQNAFFAIYETSMKFGWVRASGGMQRYVPLANDTTLLQLTAAWVAVVLFFVTALRLVRAKPAFGIYAIAFALSLGTWLSYKLGTIYDRVFTPDELRFDYVLLLLMALMGLGVWLVERRDVQAAGA